MTESIRPSIARKIGIVAASFSIPIAVLLFLVVSNINEFIRFGTWEKSGTTFMRPLEELLCNIQNHQILAHLSDRDDAIGLKLVNIRAAVERALANLDAINRRVGTDLEFTEGGLAARNRQHLRISNLRKQWKELVAIAGKGTLSAEVLADLDARQTRLVTDIRGMITHVGDTSNLILDPDLDSYYLMDVTLLALPQFQERVARVTNLGRDIILRGGPTPEERIQLAIHAAMLQESDLNRIVASTNTSLNEDRKFYGVSPSLQSRMPTQLAKFVTSATGFIEMTRQLATSETPLVSVSDFVASGSLAHDASFRFWTVAESELDKLLSARISAYTSRRTWSLVLAGISVLFASGLAWLVTQSITRPLGNLVRTLSPGALRLRESAERIAVCSMTPNATPIESFVICEELNSHAEDIRKTVHELESLVKGATTFTNDEEVEEEQDFLCTLFTK